MTKDQEQIILICDRCGVKFRLDYPDGCTAVPPDRQQRFHIHYHKFVNNICSECGVPDTRMTFGL